MTAWSKLYSLTILQLLNVVTCPAHRSISVSVLRRSSPTSHDHLRSQHPEAPTATGTSKLL